MSSIGYYDQNAEAFYARTINVDVSSLYSKFLPHLKKPCHILDLGCGAGRDALYFKEQGFQVTAVDGSEELVAIASEVIGQEAIHLLFEEISYVDTFDAIWANASLLHVSFDALRATLENLHHALKKDGIFYASFKYGDSMRETEGRVFSDFNETSILPHLEGLFDPLDIWKTADSRSNQAASPSHAWLNFIAKKLD